jgi:hypothetical protein
MTRSPYLLTIVGFLVLCAGCKKQENDTDAIRSGINQHLASLKTLNLGAMDMNITKVSVQGNQAQAEVEFKPKAGATQDSGMQVAYSLEKQNGIWVVQDTKAVGGSSQHPGPGENAPTGAAPPSRWHHAQFSRPRSQQRLRHTPSRPSPCKSQRKSPNQVSFD